MRRKKVFFFQYYNNNFDYYTFFLRIIHYYDLFKIFELGLFMDMCIYGKEIDLNRTIWELITKI